MNDGKGLVSGVGEWHMRLDCGHVVAVPWGTQPPFVLACVVQHQHGCSAERVARDPMFPGIEGRAGPRMSPTQ